MCGPIELVVIITDSLLCFLFFKIHFCLHFIKIRLCFKNEKLIFRNRFRKRALTTQYQTFKRLTIFGTYKLQT